MSSITAILVAYNSAEVIADTLRALADEVHLADILVVDNCSTDGTCELIQRDFPNVTLIENPRNLGFGCANNIGLSRVKTPYALLINPDAVLHPGALSALLASAHATPDAAILAPQLVDEKGVVHVSYKRTVFARERDGGAALLPEGDLCAEYLSGAVWLVEMAHLRQIGFFDPRIFLYYEDDDLCLRTRKAGFSNVLVAAARATHHMGNSSGAPSPAGEFFKQRHLLWSRLYLEEKYHGPRAAQRLARKLRVQYALKAAYYALSFNKQKLTRHRARLTGIADYLLAL